MKWQRKWSRWGFGLALSAVFAITACNPDQQVALGGTRAWIDVPRDRSVISLKPHEVMVHASDVGGLRQVELIVNNTSIGAMTCENLTQPLVTCRVMWNPLAPGDYRLEARATSPRGAVGTSAPVFVTIGIVSPPQAITTTPTRAPALPPVQTSTPTPLSEPAQIVTLTPTRPSTFAPTPSLTPPSPLPPAINTNIPTRSPTLVCPGAPVITNFTASPTAITQGQSSTLSWGSVSNATSVEIDHGIGGVPTPGSRAVNPQTTTTYMLTASGCGGTVTRQATIIVSPAPPANTPTRTPTLQQPPAAPSNLRQVSRSCGTPDQIRIEWDDNSNNETGFRIYRRLRENSSSPWTAWSLRATVGANTELYTDTSGFNKSQDVEYEVKAYNSAGELNGPNLFLSECPF